MVEMFMEGGWGMWAILIFGLTLIGAAVRFAARPRRGQIPFIAAMALTTLVSTAHATWTALGAVFNAMSDEKRVPDGQMARDLHGGHEGVHAPGLLRRRGAHPRVRALRRGRAPDEQERGVGLSRRAARGAAPGAGSACSPPWRRFRPARHSASHASGVCCTSSSKRSRSSSISKVSSCSGSSSWSRSIAAMPASAGSSCRGPAPRRKRKSTMGAVARRERVAPRVERPQRLDLVAGGEEQQRPAPVLAEDVLELLGAVHLELPGRDEVAELDELLARRVVLVEHAAGGPARAEQLPERGGGVSHDAVPTAGASPGAEPSERGLELRERVRVALGPRRGDARRRASRAPRPRARARRASCRTSGTAARTPRRSRAACRRSRARRRRARGPRTRARGRTRRSGSVGARRRSSSPARRGACAHCASTTPMNGRFRYRSAQSRP